MHEAKVAEIIKRINALEVGSRFTLDALLHDVWDQIGSGLTRRQFGSEFSVAVRKGAIPCCRWLGPQGTNRTVTYERIA